MNTNTYQRRKHWVALLLMSVGFVMSCNKAKSPVNALNTASGLLARVDLVSYDPLPVTNFVLSYTGGQLSNLFFKNATSSSYTLETLNLIRSGVQLDSVLSSSRTNQSFFYGASGKVLTLKYANPLDTGKVTFFYDASGMLTSYQDSVKKQNLGALKTRWELGYDALGNVSKVLQYAVDAGGTAKLQFVSALTYDSNTNPFVTLPVLRNLASLSAAGYGLLFNRNNVVSYDRKELRTASLTGGATSDVPDTVLIYHLETSYTYKGNGQPNEATSRYQDYNLNILGNYKLRFFYGGN